MTYTHTHTHTHESRNIRRNKQTTKIKVEKKRFHVLSHKLSYFCFARRCDCESSCNLDEMNGTLCLELKVYFRAPCLCLEALCYVCDSCQ